VQPTPPTSTLGRRGPASPLAREDFGEPLHSIVVPGELHFLEEEALKVLAGLEARIGT
jgi:diphthine synthase